jgi:hypothetical protein
VIGLPTVGVNWQRFAGIYNPTTLEVNHLSGQPGSFFTITGTNYPPNTNLTIFANGVSLGSLPSDGGGNLLFVIDTSGAELGYYTIVADPIKDVFTRFELKANDPLWPQDVTAPVLQLTPNSAVQLIFLPNINR